MAASSIAIDISKVSDESHVSVVDHVAVEEPLEIRLGYSTPDGRAVRSISITMRTPGFDAELAVGFLHSESIIGSANDIASVEVCAPAAPDSGNHNVIRVELGPDVRVDFGRLQRHFYTTSSCGVCGKTSLDALRITGFEPLPAVVGQFTAAMLTTIPGKLRAAQVTFDDTGGLHAAAVFDINGEILAMMEDVGRHNAVDKVIGSLLLQGRLPATNCGIMVSGRASFELMQKSLAAGLPLLAAVSAPSSLAVQLAREFNITLIGFLRGQTFNMYSGETRIS